MTLDLVPTAPVHTEIQRDDWYEGLDSGIRYPVRVLHHAGIPTCQSCEGGDGHAYPEPSIDMTEPRAFEAMDVLTRHGIEVVEVASVWRIKDSVPDERVWRVKLRRAVGELADERPMFVHGHLHHNCWRPPPRKEDELIAEVQRAEKKARGE